MAKAVAKTSTVSGEATRPRRRAEPSAADKQLLERGKARIEWALQHMGVLRKVRSRLVKERAFKGLKVGMALHVEAKTAVLALAIKEAGAEVRLASCNPESTDNSVSLALNEHYGLETFAKKGETKDEYYANLNAVLDLKPDFVIDDGGDLTFLAHQKRTDALKGIRGGCEETTTGIVRIRGMAADGKLRYPIIDVNNAKMKHLFDNRYGTGQSTFDGLFTATNLIVAGKTFVVAGYGWCGRGIALKADGLGADVIVTEIDPVKAVEARLDGFRVMPMTDACREADFIVTVTGCKQVVSSPHVPLLKDGVVLANAGHFDVEIDKDALEAASSSVREVRDYVDEYKLRDGRKVYLLGHGRLVNLVAGQGHPVEIMDMSFSLQILSLEHLVKNAKKLEPLVYAVPEAADELVARYKLDELGLRIDALTETQAKYLSSWEEGT
jgi:adenosylhomocysteinase